MVNWCVSVPTMVCSHKPAAKLHIFLHTCKFICDFMHNFADLFADFKKMQYFCTQFRRNKKDERHWRNW